MIIRIALASRVTLAAYIADLTRAVTTRARRIVFFEQTISLAALKIQIENVVSVKRTPVSIHMNFIYCIKQFIMLFFCDRWTDSAADASTVRRRVPDQDVKRLFLGHFHGSSTIKGFGILRVITP